MKNSERLFDQLYERTLARLLSSHLEQAVPHTTDLWPVIEQRLAQGAVERLAGEAQPVTPSSVPAPHPARTTRLQRTRKPVALLAGTAALLLIAVLMLYSLSGLVRRQEQITPPRVPIATQTSPPNEEATLLFTIPTGGDDFHYDPQRRRYSRFSLYGFDVADNGSFWLNDADNRLLHYSPAGKRLGITELAPRVPQVEDLKIQGSNVWIAYKQNGVQVDKLSLDGALLEQYRPIISVPGGMDWLLMIRPEFVEGGDGQMLLTVSSQYVKVENVDIIKTGKQMITLQGFPGRDKFYTRPENNAPDVIMAGDLPVQLSGYGDVQSWTILKEMPDRSFYVALAVEAKNVPGVPKGTYSYVLHYAPDGKLIQRARVPIMGRYGRLPLELTIAPNGDTYILRVPDDPPLGAPVDRPVDRLEILRLNFYPASAPLPPIPTPTNTPVLPTAIPTAPRSPIVIPPAVPTEAPPTPTFDVTSVELVPDGDGFRLQGLRREYVFAGWIDSSRFLVPLAHPSSPYIGDLIVDLDTGKLTHREAKDQDVKGEYRTVVNSEGSYALLLHDAIQYDPIRAESSQTVTVALLDTRSGRTQTLFNADPTAPQLAGPDARNWQFGEARSALSATWIDPHTFILARTPLGDGEHTVSAWNGWGKLLLGNAPTGALRVLAEQGDVVAVLPDRSLLIRRGWIDGEVSLVPPPYTGKGAQILPGGAWRYGWALSHDGARLAWFDIQPPPGDWSRRLPTAWMSPDPQPVPSHIAVWDTATGQTKRFPVKDARWEFDTYLTWRKDNSALLYVSHPPEVTFTDLSQLTLDGKTTHLARHDGNFIYGIRVEGADGSIYYEATSDRQHDSRLMRVPPGGAAEVVCAYLGLYCALDGQRLITVHDTEIVIQDLPTGTTNRVPTQGEEQVVASVSMRLSDGVKLSPDGRWLALYEFDRGMFHFLRVKP